MPPFAPVWIVLASVSADEAVALMQVAYTFAAFAVVGVFSS